MSMSATFSACSLSRSACNASNCAQSELKIDQVLVSMMTFRAGRMSLIHAEEGPGQDLMDTGAKSSQEEGELTDSCVCRIMLSATRSCDSYPPPRLSRVR